MDESNRGSAKEIAANRSRSGQKRQAAAKKAGAARIRSGQERQAAAKKKSHNGGTRTS